MDEVAGVGQGEELMQRAARYPLVKARIMKFLHLIENTSGDKLTSAATAARLGLSANLTRLAGADKCG